jgi:hypothetical protein
MSSNTRDLMLSNSILSNAQEIYHNYMDNAKAKDAGQEYFAILLSITTDDFNQPSIEVILEKGNKETIQINTLVARSIKSVSGASAALRSVFGGKLKQYIEALKHRRKPRLIKRYCDELQDAFIDAYNDDCGKDQEQMRGAFETFAELLRMLKIKNTPEAAQQMAEIEKMMKEMQERGIGTNAAEKALANSISEDEEEPQ